MPALDPTYGNPRLSTRLRIGSIKDKSYRVFNKRNVFPPPTNIHSARHTPTTGSGSVCKPIVLIPKLITMVIKNFSNALIQNIFHV